MYEIMEKIILVILIREKKFILTLGITRHGLITGSTGSGKTTTVKVIIEEP